MPRRRFNHACGIPYFLNEGGESVKKFLGLLLLSFPLVGVTGCPKRPLISPLDWASIDAENAIASAGKAISAAKGVGADTAIAESLLNWAKSFYDEGDYPSATSRAWEAEVSANEARARAEVLAKAKGRPEREFVEEKEIMAEEKEERIAEKAPKIYVVGTWERGRDCLWNIAKKPTIYGDPWKWKRIYKANTDKIEDPDLIYPNQRLVIP